MAWSVFAEAPNQTVAESWCRYAVECGVPCRLYPGDISSFMGVGVRSVRLMTQAGYVARAKVLIDELQRATKDDSE